MVTHEPARPVGDTWKSGLDEVTVTVPGVRPVPVRVYTCAADEVPTFIGPNTAVVAGAIVIPVADPVTDTVGVVSAPVNVIPPDGVPVAVGENRTYTVLAANAPAV